MAGCWNDVQDLLTSVNDPDKTYPDRICRSSGCDTCECRVLLPEEVRIGEARHVSPLGEIRIEMRVTCHQGEGSLQCPLFNLPILPEQNGRVKK